MKSIRCCCPRGRLFIQDIIGYGDPAIDAYVEELEIAIDSSHARTLLRDEFTDLYTEAGLRGIHGAEFRIRLDFVNYVGHAVQSEEMQAEIDKLIEMGLGDAKLSSVFELQDRRLYLLRNVLFLGGRKDEGEANRPVEGAPRPRILRLKLSEPSNHTSH